MAQENSNDLIMHMQWATGSLDVQYTYYWPYYELFYELLHAPSPCHELLLLHALDWYLADTLGIILTGIVASILTSTFTT